MAAIIAVPLSKGVRPPCARESVADVDAVIGPSSRSSNCVKSRVTSARRSKSAISSSGLNSGSDRASLRPEPSEEDSNWLAAADFQTLDGAEVHRLKQPHQCLAWRESW